MVFVDDILLYSNSNAAIHNVITWLMTNDTWIHLGSTAVYFLGVPVSHCKTPFGLQISLTQEGVTKRRMEALDLCTKYFNTCPTPVEASPLPKDSLVHLLLALSTTPVLLACFCVCVIFPA